MAATKKSTTYDSMIGRTCPVGPGGRDCACCGEAPGKPRTAQRRTVKRREKQNWKRSVRQGRFEDLD